MPEVKTKCNPKPDNAEKCIVLQYAEMRHGIPAITGFIPAIMDGNVCEHYEIRETANSICIPLVPGNISEFRFNGGIIHGARFTLHIGQDFPCGEYHVEIAGVKQSTISKVPIDVGKNFPLSFNYRHQHLRLPDGRFFQLTSDRGFRIVKATAISRLISECLFIFELLKHWTVPEFVAAATRLSYWIWRPFHRGRYWIFSDKLSNPIDSAYSIAKALVNNSEFSKEKVKAYYLVDGRHSLRVNLPNALKTIRYLSLRHRLISLAAEANITSENGYSPFAPAAPYSDITAWQLRVCSLHGLVHHDLSALYGRDFYNFNLMIAGVEREAEYERSGLWGYEAEDVVCTGLPRWDDRTNAPEKKIYFSFTWRNNLVEGVDPVTKERKYGSLLEKSEYRNRLQALLSDPSLHDIAMRLGYSLEFLPHPLLREALGFFSFPEYVHIVPDNIPYENIYRDAFMLITDYSSIAMDMAYLGKPVVYYQFDHDDFYATQGYTESYFSWRDDGFGPVVDSQSAVVDEIVSVLNRNGHRELKYEERAKRFFPPQDKQNGARACKAIFSKINSSRYHAF